MVSEDPSAGSASAALSAGGGGGLTKMNIKNKNEMKKKKIWKFSKFKIKWPKSGGKVKNGGRLGPPRQKLPPPQIGPLDPPVVLVAVSLRMASLKWRKMILFLMWLLTCNCEMVK